MQIFFLQITQSRKLHCKDFTNTEKEKNKFNRGDCSGMSEFNLTIFQDIAEVSCTKIDLN